LEPIKAKYPGVTYADLWTLAGAYYIEKAGGPKIAWRPGRTDSAKETGVPDGRLPNADCGTPANNVAHIRSIFGRMGFNDRETVALIGAHALGRCHTQASGYWGPWTRAETTFSNEFFRYYHPETFPTDVIQCFRRNRLLIEEPWTLKTTHNGAKWTGPMQFESRDKTLMMLPNDIALAQDSEFRKHVETYAKDESAFFNDFAAAFSKMLELGVPYPQQKKGWW
jgi:cytochrome c peroxidase